MPLQFYVFFIILLLVKLAWLKKQMFKRVRIDNKNTCFTVQTKKQFYMKVRAIFNLDSSTIYCIQNIRIDKYVDVSWTKIKLWMIQSFHSVLGNPAVLSLILQSFVIESFLAFNIITHLYCFTLFSVHLYMHCIIFWRSFLDTKKPLLLLELY